MDQKNQQDHIAKAIAAQLIKWQASLATVMNNWINSFSKQQQKWMLALFCILLSSGLILCLVLPYGQKAMNKLNNNYQPIHIGAASERPAGSPTIDSLTSKK